MKATASHPVVTYWRDTGTMTFTNGIFRYWDTALICLPECRDDGAMCQARRGAVV